MNKIKVILIMINLSLLTANLKFDSIKLGNSESLGIFGIASMDFDLTNFSKDNDYFYFTLGIFPIPIFGGAGLTYKKYFNSFEINPISNTYFKPYVSTTLFSYYVLGFSASSDSPIKNGLMTTLGFGADFSVLKTKNIAINLQAGVYSQFDFLEMELFESPSDQPEFWPTINIKFSK